MPSSTNNPGSQKPMGKHAEGAAPLPKDEQKQAENIAKKKPGQVRSAQPIPITAAQRGTAPVEYEIYEEPQQAGSSDSASFADEYAFVPATPAAGGQEYPSYNPSQYAGASLQDEQEMAQAQAKRKRRRRRGIIAAVLIVFVCLVGAGAAGAMMYLNNINQNVAMEEEEAEEVKEVLTPAPIGDDPFYMLLVGCDDRVGVEGVRADTTILARLDPKNNVVTLISIPRDTAIEIPGYGMQKFNAAYTYGGPSGTIKAASELCGVDISHYAEVHFEALIDIVDYVGGVDVDVPIPIDDVDAGGKLDAGYQHLNGEQAMIFARSRSYATGDFQRTTSQRLLIEAAVKKVMSLPATELPGLLMKVSQSMTTDLSVQELLGLAMAFQDEPPLVMYSAMIPSTTADIDQIAYVLADEPMLKEMMDVVDQGGDPSTVVASNDTVSTSQEATAAGIGLIINYGDDTPDDGAYGATTDTTGYGNGSGYGTSGAYDYSSDDSGDDASSDYSDGGDEEPDDSGDAGDDSGNDGGAESDE